ncbi:MAG: TetR family transcriptional regulator [Spirochaetaceae bacterium]|nr:TetR family transcriptional regulator [Spirochaetaceae bacterium]
MSAGVRRGPGRPADDGADRRQAILDAAREQFAEKGYAAASVRAIARVADVDPALVHHYFGSKEKVFVAAMELPFDPADRLSVALEGDLDDLAERLTRMFLGMWADPMFRTPMLGLVRSAFTSEQGATMLREFVGEALLGRVAQAASTAGPVDPLRVQAAAGQLVGVVILRYVVRLEPLASASDEDLVALVAPVVHRHLYGG